MKAISKTDTLPQGAAVFISEADISVDSVKPEAESGASCKLERK